METRVTRVNSGGTTEPSSRSRARAFAFPAKDGEKEVPVAVATPRIAQLVPTRRERLADLETPVSAFAKLRPLGAFLLESAEGGVVFFGDPDPFRVVAVQIAKFDAEDGGL